MDRLDVLKAYARLVECGSFTQVARELATSQPTISRQVSDLEKRLGARLLQRSTRKVSPTEAGLGFSVRAKVALAAVDDADDAVSRSFAGYKGLLRVTAPFAYGCHVVMPAVKDFKATYPRVQVELVLNDRYLDLVRDGIDVAIRIGALPDSSYHARPLGVEELVVVAAPAYLAERGVPRDLSDLEHHDGIVLMNRGAPARWTFRSRVGVVERGLRGPLRVDSMVAAHYAARAGLGLAIVPNYLADDDLRAGTLVQVLAKSPAVGFRVHAVFPEAQRIPARVKAFAAHLATSIKTLSKGLTGTRESAAD